MRQKQYRIGLREKVIAHIESVNDQITSSKIFKVGKRILKSKSTIEVEHLRMYVEASRDKSLK